MFNKFGNIFIENKYWFNRKEEWLLRKIIKDSLYCQFCWPFHSVLNMYKQIVNNQIIPHNNKYIIDALMNRDKSLNRNNRVQQWR